MNTYRGFSVGQRVRVATLPRSRCYGRVTGVAETEHGYVFHVLLDTGERGAYAAEALFAVRVRRRKGKQ